MSVKYLAVDSDVQLAESEAVAWATRGISMDRVDSMTEAIQKLLTKDSYLYIGINDDAVDFMPMLSLMRNLTNTPILIATSRFITETEVAALDNGADLYARWHKSPDKNMASVLAHISRTVSRAKNRIHIPRILVCGNLITFTDYKMVFCNDREVLLTAKEYGILDYFLANRNITLSISQIIIEAWRGEEVSDEAVWKTIDRLRRRLTDSGFAGGSIVNIKGMGYRLRHDLEPE